MQPGLAGRFDVRTDGDVRLKKNSYQGIPRGGYTAFMGRMLRGIRVFTKVDYLRHRNEFPAVRLVIFTGPIDEFFKFDMGRLAYRGQRRAHVFLTHVDWHQPVPQINYPDINVPYIRIVEWKHMMEPEAIPNIRGTVIATETPYMPLHASDYEYPFPDTVNQQLYRRYRDRADSVGNLLVCGRLGEFRYYDMDQAIGRALTIAGRIVRGRQTHEHLECPRDPLTR